MRSQGGRTAPARPRSVRKDSFVRKDATMLWATPLSHEVENRDLLRDLIWCGLCDILMRRARLATNRRFYGCTSPRCPRPLLPADLLDTLAWQAFLYLFADPGAELTPDEQHQALNHALERVTIGVDLGHVRYQWRDLP